MGVTACSIGSKKSTIVYVFIVTFLLTNHRHLIVQYDRSFFKSVILLQQLIAPLEGVSSCPLLGYVLHHLKGNERTGDLSGWTSQQPLHGSILLVKPNLRRFGAIFKILSGHRKSRIYPNPKIFSPKYFK